jgi:hypothetical protein
MAGWRRVQVSWLWPRQLNKQDSVAVRIGRVIHWAAIGFAIFGAVVSFYGLVEAQDQEPNGYFAVLCVWIAAVMLGRGLRYIIARE